MRKQISKTTFSLSTIAILITAGYSLHGFASERGGGNNERRRDREERGGGFNELKLGICVGQTLSQQGIILALEPGQSLSSLDSTTLDAIEAAVTTCREPTNPTPTPSPTPIVTPPTASPTPAPTTTADPTQQ